MDERRQLPRWEINKAAKVWMTQTQGLSNCVVEDMHLKGMRISCDKQVFQQPVVSLSFSIGDNFESIKIEAQIPWAKEDQDRHVYGLSFTKIGDYDKEKIYQYISTNCSDQFKDKWWGKE